MPRKRDLSSRASQLQGIGLEARMATWNALAHLAEEMATTGSRLKKRAAVAEALTLARQGGTPRDAGLFAMYLSGLPFPEADSRKLNVGGAMMSRVVNELTGSTEAERAAAYRRHGDLGAAAHDLFAAMPARSAGEPLTLGDVERFFDEIATARSTAIRRERLTAMLSRASALDAKYLIKLALGDMRIGVKQALVEEAIAVASAEPLSAVRNAVMLQADLAEATAMAFESRLSEARMRLFHPLGFMLASPVDTPQEAIKRFASTPEAAREADLTAEPASQAEPNPHPREEDESAIEQLVTEHVPVTALHINAQIEDKYDGMRVQLHCGDPAHPGRVALYSRNREDVTAGYPEISEAFAFATDSGRRSDGSADGLHAPPLVAARLASAAGDGATAEAGASRAGGIILDGELLAWDVGQQRALPFAVLSPRIGRKRVTNEIRTSTPVVFMAFDVLFSAGELLLELPLRERRCRLEALAAKLQPATLSPLALPAPMPSGGLFVAAQQKESTGEQRFLLSPVTVAHSAADLDVAYADARDRGNEGVMIKAADSLYQPGRRGLAWLKLKRHLDTLDVVITGAEFGSGRKSPFLSDYTFAIRGPEGDLQNVGKAYSGVTDAEIAELTEWLKTHTLEDFGHYRTVEPAIILEVAFNNVMRSSRHGSGFALRFPRIVRIRTDKPLSEIDTLARVEEIYQSQPDKPVELATPQDT